MRGRQCFIMAWCWAWDKILPKPRTSVTNRDYNINKTGVSDYWLVFKLPHSSIFVHFRTFGHHGSSYFSTNRRVRGTTAVHHRVCSHTHGGVRVCMDWLWRTFQYVSLWVESFLLRRLIRIWISIIKKKRSWERLIFILGIFILVRRRLYIKNGPGVYVITLLGLKFESSVWRIFERFTDVEYDFCHIRQSGGVYCYSGCWQKGVFIYDWFVANVKQQAITWAKVYPPLHRHMASLGHSEITWPMQCALNCLRLFNPKAYCYQGWKLILQYLRHAAWFRAFDIPRWRLLTATILLSSKSRCRQPNSYGRYHGNRNDGMLIKFWSLAATEVVIWQLLWQPVPKI